ncbi:MAG: class I poly(R)-hydroxyalkanoic acid synthase [Xanthobacteraceae bacterium]|nr:class I poly(R)-hydroxyalkanoic acid synthase [Xanthobacteraceae bacterium]MCW5678801.1 class I poly(R)-hydroxyalkanoic acid synthase [Xanthobacteraceae bacterium]
MDDKPKSGVETPRAVDPEAFARNLARVMEQGGKALAAYLKPREAQDFGDAKAEEMVDVFKTLNQVAEYWLSDPQRAATAQNELAKGYMDLWAMTIKRMAGEHPEPVKAADPKDRRFNDPDWNNNPFFDALKQAYLLTADWAERMVREAEGIDEHTRRKAEFYVKQISNAVSPSNFVLTNPELFRETLGTSGENLVRGMQMLTEDIEAGKGDLRIRQSDSSMFEVGRNLATTPGKVVFQNDLIQVIQYTPVTENVLAVPLVIVPPWINKFYVLDLTGEKSMIKWAVEQGITVFVISWVNPDAQLAMKSFQDYMNEGVLAALDVAEKITGEKQSHICGYCVGGTMTAVSLAYLAATGQDRIASATFLATQVDFTYAGDLKVFVDEDQLEALERRMKQVGFLDSTKMAMAFNMLRSNDLVWPYIVNNYMRGKAPFPFDLLYWNSDSTRLPAANHSFYLRNCYLENKLSAGKMVIDNVRLDLGKVKVPVYNLATREDHIAPPKSVFLGSSFFGGPVRFVLGGSGHIAGVVNPPEKKKYSFWTGGPADGELDKWIENAIEHKGSWWTDWLAWLKDIDRREVPARMPGEGPLPALEDAPGSYVKVKA